MLRRREIGVFGFLVLLSASGRAWASDARYVTLSTVKARAVAMGGAFVSISDDLAALDFNPAGFSVLTSLEGIGFSAYLNPMGPVLMAENLDRVSGWDTALGWLVKGAAFRVGRLQLGVLFGEESLGDGERLNRSRLFGGGGYIDRRSTSFGFSLALAERVSLGMAGELYQRRVDSRTMFFLRYRYGLIVKPRGNLSVGICFVDLPHDDQQDRMAVERLADETLNVGISYTPVRILTLALDVRNVSDEGKGAALEPHAGFEFVPWRHAALRGGYFREWDSGVDSYSVGLGIFDWNVLYPEHKRFLHPSPALNASVVWQVGQGRTLLWFFLSMLVRI